METNAPAPPAFQPENRNYPQLFAALTEALRVLSWGGDERDALRDSFEAAAEGCGARKALLLLVEQQGPLQLRNLHVKGKLTLEQVRAAERGESVPGVSSQTIRKVVETKQAIVIQDPRLAAEALRTAAFGDGEAYSVLCAPVCNPLTGDVLAVLYFQNGVLGEAYVEGDLSWLDTYTQALGQLFAYHLQARLREEELNAAFDGQRPDNAPDLVGESHQTQRLRRDLHEIYIPAASADQPDPVLILGEKGTGKEVVARYIQAYSDRRSGPFVVANSAEITTELASARFFGHKQGSFTGAVRDAKGLFREAHRGVLFLDEIAHLPKAAQGALLRVLDQRTVQPVGGHEQIPVDVLLILATNRNLVEAVEQGEFLPDLHDRIRTGHTIELPPLRERPLDVPPLLEHFRLVHERRLRRRTLGFAPEAFGLLNAYHWPGNVRELAGVCSKLVTYARPGAKIDRDVLARAYPLAMANTDGTAVGGAFRDLVRAYERGLIMARLEVHDGNAAGAAASLALPESTFRRYLRSFAAIKSGD